MKNILVIGSLNADMTIHTDRMPSLGETVEGYDFSVNAGETIGTVTFLSI